MRSRLTSHMLTFFCDFVPHFSLWDSLQRTHISLGLGLLLHRGVFAPMPRKCDLLSSLQRRTFAGEITISAAPVVTKNFFDLLPLSECCLESYLRMKVSSEKPTVKEDFSSPQIQPTLEVLHVEKRDGDSYLSIE